MSAVKSKRPGDRLDFAVDFFRWLQDGDRIVSASATLDGSTATIDDTQHSDTAVKVWILGGTIGETAAVGVTITTEQGRTRQECFRLRIEGCPSC